VTTKKDIVKEIAERTGLTQAITKRVVQETLDAILDALAREGRIELRNFGVFVVRTRAERRARNPKTGEDVIVPSKRVVGFKPGRGMEARIK